MRSELLDLYKILSPYPEVKETLKQLKNAAVIFVWYPTIIKIGPNISIIIAGIIRIPGTPYPSIQSTVPS